MNSIEDSVRRHSSRLLAASILLAQPTLNGSAQTAPAQPVEAAAAPTPNATREPELVKLEEVVVSGIRFGIEQAIASKKENISIAETISAEDIGKLPACPASPLNAWPVAHR